MHRGIRSAYGKEATEKENIEVDAEGSGEERYARRIVDDVLPIETINVGSS